MIVILSNNDTLNIEGDMRKRNRIAATVFSTATLALLAGCATKPEGVGAPTESVGDTNKDGNYNILFITTDQEHYFSEYPEGNEFKARQLLAELGTTFEKHYACSNMSTSSRSVIYTGTHITDTEMLDNTIIVFTSDHGEMHGIGLLQKHGVPFNTLTTVNSVNMGHPEEVYSFLRKLTDHMQFLPVVESLPQDVEAVRGMTNAMPPGLYTLGALRTTAPFSVTGSGYGSFLCAVYDVWKRLDMGRKHVQLIDVAIENLKGRPASLCVHDPLCGHSGTVESNGDVYCCDRYAYENYRLGNIMRESLADLMERNRPFGMSKTYGLGSFCFECPYVKLCFGGCPKDRLDGSLNYLCKGYKMFFQRICEDREMLTAL